MSVGILGTAWAGGVSLRSRSGEVSAGMGSRLGGWMVLLLALIGAWAPPAGSDERRRSSLAIDVDDLAAFVDGFVEGRMAVPAVVGVTVSVVHDGAMIFARGYGYDDLLERRRPVDADRSLFRPGSISKTFTWTAIMQLVEQGKLDLDADIQTYLPNLEIRRTVSTSRSPWRT
jgi:CubicO group peptidase (beta-lactamase class C family)